MTLHGIAHSFIELQDGCSCSPENAKITASFWTTIDRRNLDLTKKDTPLPSAKEKPQQDCRRGTIAFKIKSLPEMLGGCKWNPVSTRTEGKEQWPPQETEPDLPLSVWVSPAEAQVSSDRPRGQRLQLQQSQTTAREHSPTHQPKIGLKIYWAEPCPQEQDPVLPTASLSKQKASTSLLGLPCWLRW